MDLSMRHKGPGKADLAKCVPSTKEDDRQEEKRLTTNCQLVNYLLASYTTDDIIVEVEANITNYKQLEALSAVSHSEVLCKKALLCGHVCTRSDVYKKFSSTDYTNQFVFQ